MEENTNVNVEVENQVPEVEPAMTALDTASATNKKDLAIGIAGAVVICLAIPTVVHGVKLGIGWIKKLAKGKTVEPASDEATEEQ